MTTNVEIVDKYDLSTLRYRSSHDNFFQISEDRWHSIIPVSDSVKKRLRSSLKEYITRILRERNGIVNNAKWREGYARHISGSNGSPFDTYNDVVMLREPQNNGKLWREAKTSSPLPIVVSDYEVAKVEIQATPGSRDEVTQRLYTGRVFSLSQFGFEKVPYRWGERYEYSGSAFMWDGYYCDFDGFLICEDYLTCTRTFSMPQVPIPPGRLLELCSMEIDKGMVTSVIADADSGCIDALTTMAEMPETVRSIVDGFRAVARLIIDVKRKQLTISSSFDKRKKSLKARYDKDMARLAKIRSERVKTRVSNEQLRRREQKATETYLKSLNGLSKELENALIDVWMNFRYNIMPNVFTACDFWDYYNSYDADHLTKRDRSMREIVIELEGWSPNLVIDVRDNCVIKRAIDPYAPIPSLVKGNILTTAWELIPLSFVVDWFINIGDWLTSISSPKISPGEGATYGSKFSCEATLVNDETSSTCRYKLSKYKRVVIHPEKHRSLQLSFDLSFYRKLDAAALLWRPIRDLLIASKGK